MLIVPEAAFPYYYRIIFSFNIRLISEFTKSEADKALLFCYVFIPVTRRVKGYTTSLVDRAMSVCPDERRSQRSSGQTDRRTWLDRLG